MRILETEEVKILKNTDINLGTTNNTTIEMP